MPIFTGISVIVYYKIIFFIILIKIIIIFIIIIIPLLFKIIWIFSENLCHPQLKKAVISPDSITIISRSR